MSPTPGRSILITSAPNQARSWVQVGPDCTWVKSRMRTPSSALPIVSTSLVHGLSFGPRRVFPRVDPNIDNRRSPALLDRLARPSERRGDLGGIAHFLPITAEHLGKFAERHVAQQIADIAALLAVF